MDYAAHYSRLIERARGRVLDCYTERHHIVPRCMGGGNEPANIVRLTGEEHYVAHQLLVKIHPSVSGLALAACRMSRQAIGAKAYGWLRERNAKEVSKRMTGRKPTAEETEKRVAKLRGRKRSPEVCAKMSLAATGRKHTPEARARMTASRTGVKRGPMSAETKARIGAANRGRPKTPETLLKASIAQRGKRHTEEQKAKISAALKGRPKSPEHVQRVAAALRARFESSQPCQ